MGIILSKRYYIIKCPRNNFCNFCASVTSDSSLVKCKMIMIQNKLKNRISNRIKWIAVDTNQADEWWLYTNNWFLFMFWSPNFYVSYAVWFLSLHWSFIGLEPDWLQTHVVSIHEVSDIDWLQTHVVSIHEVSDIDSWCKGNMFAIPALDIRYVKLTGQPRHPFHK